MIYHNGQNEINDLLISLWQKRVMSAVVILVFDEETYVAKTINSK